MLITYTCIVQYETLANDNLLLIFTEFAPREHVVCAC